MKVNSLQVMRILEAGARVGESQSLSARAPITAIRA